MLIKLNKQIPDQKTYQAALQLVAQIDRHLTNGTRHYYANGQPLQTLNQVINALLQGCALADLETRA